MLVQMPPSQVQWPQPRELAHEEPTTRTTREFVPHVLRIAFDRIAVSIIVTRPTMRDESGAADLRMATRGDAPTGKAMQVHVTSLLLYNHLEKLQGKTNPGKVLVVDPRCVRDPAIERLVRVLVAANEVEQDLGALHTDAICLALVTRFLAMHSDLQFPTAGRRPTALPKWRLKRVCDYIDNHLDGAITLADMAGAAGLTRMHFAAQFRVATGVRPHEYVLRQRVERAQELLRGSTLALVDVALSVGFQTQAHFTTVFRRFADETPHRWRRAVLDVPRLS